MAFEVRPARLDEMEQFHRVASTALMQSPTKSENVRPEWTLCGFEDGKLATSMGFWPLTLCSNGGEAALSGVTNVGTLPVYRRHGHLRRIMTRHFEILHDEGERSIAALYASLTAIYQRYGYGVVTTHYHYTLEPRYIQFSSPFQPKGVLREAGNDEFGLLVELYRKFRKNRMGYIHRGKAMWDKGVLVAPPPGGTMNLVVYEENDEPLGYVIYVMSPQPAGGTMPRGQIEIRDLVWLNNHAYRSIWAHFANMDLIGNIVWNRVPGDDPLPHLILEPRMLKSTATDGLLARLVDVSKILTQRQYQENGVLIFKVIDDLCPWNRGSWKLETSEKGSQVAPTRESPQMTMPVSTLAMLFFGQINASEAMRMGRLDAHEIDALRVWDRVMRTLYRPACADSF